MSLHYMITILELHPLLYQFLSPLIFLDSLIRMFDLAVSSKASRAKLFLFKFSVMANFNTLNNIEMRRKVFDDLLRFSIAIYKQSCT